VPVIFRRTYAVAHHAAAFRTERVLTLSSQEGELPAILDRIFQRIETTNRGRRDTQIVVIEERLSHLFYSADEGRLREGRTRQCNRVPAPRRPSTPPRIVRDLAARWENWAHLLLTQTPEPSRFTGKQILKDRGQASHRAEMGRSTASRIIGI
jgi:hypothetical protein